MIKKWAKLLSLPILFILFLVISIPVATAGASQQANVVVTATGAFLNITVSPTSYDFGTIDGATTPNTIRSYFSCNSTSSIAIDVLIKADTWTSGGTAWTQGASAYNTGRLKVSVDSLSFNVTLTTSTTNFTDGLPASGSFGWEMQLEAPSDFADSNQNSSNVTLQAYRM